MKAAIRVKVSHQAGFGHWVRQCHLAKALIEAGWQVTLFPDQYERLGSVPDGSKLHPVTGNGEFLEALKNPVELAILDIHETTPELIAEVRKSAGYVAGFEDLGSGRNHLDCLIDCNLPPESSREAAGSVETLFGRDYSLLAPEYQGVLNKSREFSKGIQSILVTMGGSDPNNLTTCVAGTLLEKFPELKLTVVSGPGFLSSDAPLEVSKNAGVTHEVQPASLAPLFLRHDAVICSGGITLHEALVSGTPSFVVPQVAHQERLALNLQKEGAAILIGKPGKVETDKLISAVHSSPKKLAAMSSTGRRLFDGRGLNRLVDFFRNLPKQKNR